MSNYIEEVKAELTKHLRIGKGLQDVYAILVLVKGEDVTLKDVHDAWSVNILRTWDHEQFGAHRSVIPFDQLSPEVQAKDQQYVDGIKATARAIKERGF